MHFTVSLGKNEYIWQINSKEQSLRMSDSASQSAQSKEVKMWVLKGFFYTSVCLGKIISDLGLLPLVNSALHIELQFPKTSSHHSHQNSPEI